MNYLSCLLFFGLVRVKFKCIDNTTVQSVDGHLCSFYCVVFTMRQCWLKHVSTMFVQTCVFTLLSVSIEVRFIFCCGDLNLVSLLKFYLNICLTFLKLIFNFPCVIFKISHILFEYPALLLFQCFNIKKKVLDEVS